MPGRVELSRLLLLVAGREKPVMPPEGNEAPKPAEIALLRRWIEAGAKGPSGKAPDPTILVTPKVPLTTSPRDAVTAVAASPVAGGPAAIASYGAVRVVSLEDRATLVTLTGIRGNVCDVKFSKDGKRVVTAAGEPGVFGEAQLWNVADGKLLKTFTGHRDSLYAVALSPDDKILATAGYDATVKLWDTATGKELHSLVGHNGAVFDVAFHPQGKIIATASADRTVKLWDVSTGKRLDTLGQPLKDQNSVAFQPGGKAIVAAGVDNRIRQWRLSPSAAENTNPLVTTRFAHEGAVIKLAYSSDGKTLVSAGEDRIVRIWDAAKLTERKALEKQPDWVPGLALSADGKMLVVGRMDGTFGVYDVTTGEAVPAKKPEFVATSLRGIQRGRATTIDVTGKYLAGVNAVELRGFFGKPVRATVRVLPDDRSPAAISLEVRPDEKLKRNTYYLVAKSPAGESNPLSLVVDDLPQVVETEPNNVTAKSPMVALEAGYWGVCAMPGDVDHYRVSLKKGTSLVARLEAKSLGSMLNGFLTVLDPDGEVVAANNDFDADQDPLAAYQAPKDGTYTVRVNDQTLSGSADHFYRLSLGTFPLVTGVFPTNVTVGRETKVELTGFNLPSGSVVAVLPAKAGDMPVQVDFEQYRVAKAPTVRGVAEAELVEQEPNDAPERAMIVAAPAYIDGRIFNAKGSHANDVDVYRFASKKGQAWIIETEAARRGSPIDTKLEILDTAGKPVPRVQLQAVLDSYVTFRSINSNENDCRLFNWREMSLDEYVYISGDVSRVFRLPQGPDSGFRFYNSNNKRRGYFDTSATAHALDEPAYVVEPHPVGKKLANNGLPVFMVNYVNDDEALRKLGSDSRILFTAPAEGEYLVRVVDVRGFGGDRFFYRLAIREPRPDFVVKLNTAAPKVTVGSGTSLTFAADRLDGFDDEIEIDADGLPEGYTLSTPIRIQAGHDEAQAVLSVAADAKPVTDAEWAKVKLTARAQVAGSPIERPIAGFTQVKLDDDAKLLVTLEPAELTIAPGQMITAKLKIDRRGVTERVAFDVLNLPHGVIVDNIGLNGILIPEGQSEREIFLTCYENTPETDRTFFALSKTARAGDKAVGAEASRPVMLHVRKPSPLAQADGPAVVGIPEKK